MRIQTLFAAVLLGSSCAAFAGDEAQSSGTPMPPEQAAYDVLHYDLSLSVFPDEKRIEGVLVMTAALVADSPALCLDLDARLQVGRVLVDGRETAFEHRAGRIRIQPATAFSGGDEVQVSVHYGGHPREAPQPPWKGGLTWEETADGKPWIATSCQAEGADLWWPCKDQPSDEPLSMDLHLRVPEPLVAVSNGALVSVENSEPGWRTYHWHVSTPINTYGVALNIAPYVAIEGDYQAADGSSFPVSFWVLPENEEKGRVFFQEILEHLRFFEDLFGPYPFRADKYGAVETPHLGMEHQTIIAYGNKYKGNPWGRDWGFDLLHHHELAHEWWANLVTARDWKDFWIHESFATYSQALYVEKLHGQEAYFEQMASLRPQILNRAAIAPRESRSTQQMYFDQRGLAPGIDIYHKGAWVLHTLRYLVGDEAMFRALRRMAYPDPELEQRTDGSACRFTDTEEILSIAEKTTGRKLDWFFELYLRQPALPELLHERNGTRLELLWKTPSDLPFSMPVPVHIDGEPQRVEMPGGRATLDVPAGAEVEIDPDGWLLKAS